MGAPKAAAKTIPLDKGFSRVIFDLSQESVPVKLSLINGGTVTGMILEVQNNIVAIEVPSDRFNAETTYIPLNSIVYAAVEKK